MKASRSESLANAGLKAGATSRAPMYRAAAAPRRVTMSPVVALLAIVDLVAILFALDALAKVLA